MELSQVGHDPALPLLADTEALAPRHSPSHRIDSHGKHTRWVAVPFRRILYGIIGITVLVALGFATYGSVIGFHAYRRLVFPHAAVHASAATVKDGTRVVRPYFGPTSQEGIPRASLNVKLWHREGTPLPPLEGDKTSHEYHYDMWLREQSGWYYPTGEQGYVQKETGDNKEWEEIWSGSLADFDIETTVKATKQVTLPGHIV
jgi:hypothetical protein